MALPISDLTLATLSKGVPFRIYINGVLFERVQDDLTNEFLADDLTGDPVYQQV
ncbi:hypothetical protein SR18_gp052c [Caulobacter phage SR18]|nr:hypothetical protein SR18_gp052c [Caulobacter phage SR18]